MLRHPFESIPPALLTRGLLVGAVGSIVTCSLTAWMNWPLCRTETPLGIVSLSLAANVPAARLILSGWDEPAAVLAAFGLGFDGLNLVVYSTTLGAACVWLAQRLKPSSPGLSSLGMVLAWLCWLAGLCDAVENAAALALLRGRVTAFWTGVGFASCVAKFSLVAAALAYLLFAGAAAGPFRRIHRVE